MTPSSPLLRAPRRLPLPFRAQAYLRCVERRGLRWEFYDARDVARIWAHNKYACFYAATAPKQEQILDETLHNLALRLAPFGFVRVHRGELVNLRFLRAIERRVACPCGFAHERAHGVRTCSQLAGRARPRRAGLVLELADGQRVAVSRRFAPHLRRTLEALSAAAPLGEDKPFVLQAHASGC